MWVDRRGWPTHIEWWKIPLPCNHAIAHNSIKRTRETQKVRKNLGCLIIYEDNGPYRKMLEVRNDTNQKYWSVYLVCPAGHHFFNKKVSKINSQGTKRYWGTLLYPPYKTTDIQQQTVYNYRQIRLSASYINHIAVKQINLEWHSKIINMTHASSLHGVDDVSIPCVIMGSSSGQYDLPTDACGKEKNNEKGEKKTYKKTEYVIGGVRLPSSTV